MAAIPGTILAAKISPGDTTATFPTHEDIYGKGGLVSVSNFQELTSIPLDRQKVGMTVHVNSDSQYYTLSSLSYPLTSYSRFIASLNTGILTKGSFDKFEVINNSGFLAKNLNTNDGYIGINTYESDKVTQSGYALIGSRLGDGFLQGSGTVRIEQAGGGLGDLRLLSLKTESWDFNFPDKSGTFALTDDLIPFALTDDLIPTVTNYLSTNNVRLSSATISNTLSISSVQIRTRPINNIFIGDSTTGNNNATGNHNFVFGLSAGNSLTLGRDNVFIGKCAGSKNDQGRFNNFLGNGAGLCNLIGECNNFFGYGAGAFNISGRNNNFFGSGAGTNNNSGTDNNFFGFSSGNLNICGSHNNFFGDQTGFCNSTGNYNNFFGFFVGRNNTTGSSNNFFGIQAGVCNTAGSSNIFLGDSAGFYNSVGNHNTFLGTAAGTNNTVGSNNNFIGKCAGYSNITGYDNIIIGNNADTANGSLSGVIAIGHGAVATQSHQIVLSTANVQFRNISNTFSIGAANQTNNLNIFGGLSSRFISLSSVEFKGNVRTGTTSVTATDSFITISVNNQTKYIRLFDVI